MKRLLSIACLSAALFVSAAPRVSAGDGVMVPGYVPPPPTAAELIATQIIATALATPRP